MGQNSILLALADPQTSDDITQALGAAWETTAVPSDTEALGLLEKRSFDALLVDFNLGSPDASDLLNQALTKHPETVRFLLAYEADLALVAAKVDGPHQILPKPIEPASLRSRIESGVAPEPSNSEQKGNEAAGGLTACPIIPSIYSEVLKALESPGVTARELGEIIARDAALSAELLGLTNSTYLGLPRNVTDPIKAAESLGSETVKVLVMALRFLAERSGLKPGYLSFEQLWKHSINVAQIARDLVLFETKDRILASQALAAGLVHDLGKVVLVSNFEDIYGRVHSLARKQPVALWDIEKEMFGANHGEIGACLLGMWNLPGYIVEAAALHHEPPVGEQQQFTPLAAVHIANVLEYELGPSDGCRVAPVTYAPFLNELGLLERLPVWRAAFANHRAANARPELESAETTQAGSTVLSCAPGSQTGNLLQGPHAATRTATLGRPGSGHATPWYRQRRWVYAGVAAGTLVLLLALWRGTQPEFDPPVPVYARTPAPDRAPAVAAANPASETPPAPISQVTPAVAVSQQTPEIASSSVTVPTPGVAAASPASETVPEAVSQVAPDAAVSQQTSAIDSSSAVVSTSAVSVPAPEPVQASAGPAAVTNAPMLSETPRVKSPPDFRLNGIIYSVGRPSAILNGETVYVGDQVNGATVLSISRTSVTLLLKGQRKTYVLR
jgi:HD-like signal output (HDOD) protein